MPKKMESRTSLVMLTLLAVLAGAYLVSNVLAFNLTSTIEKKVEDARPARIELTMITDKSCAACIDFSGIAANLPKDRLEVVKETALEWTSEEARQLIKKYSLKAVPAAIITGELNKSQAAEFFASAGLTPENQSIALQGVPPYREVATGRITGLVTLALVNDSSCAECYDVKINEAILRQSGVTLQSVQTFDIGSEKGGKLLKQYNITKVPAAVLSPDAQAYPQLLQVWAQVGSVESDGALVLRAPEVLGTYRDLVSGQIIKPENPGGSS